MMKFTQGNLLESHAEALVNTVNTVGVMGKGLALMFKDNFPSNFKAYAAACQAGDVRTGKMFVTETGSMLGPKWIINFPTKAHWRAPSKIEWIEEGLEDLKLVILENGIRSIAIPPLGAGNGGLDWKSVRGLIERSLSDLEDVEVIVYEPVAEYQNVAKRAGLKKLTPARGLIAEIIRKYSILGIQCTVLEAQKLAYFLARYVDHMRLESMNLNFKAHKFGPYSEKLRHMLNDLDGSYLHCSKRLPDAGPFEQIYFIDAEKDKLAAYLSSPEAKPYRAALDATADLIDGFESPLGMELLATVDWLVHHGGVGADVASIRASLKDWAGGRAAGERKLRLFDDRILKIAIDNLNASQLFARQ